MIQSSPLTNTNEYDNFFKTALAVKGSITPKVFPKVMVFLLYSLLISTLNYNYPQLSLPIGPFEYAGLAMGLILVYRINTGYERWSEARRLWGNIVNSSRNFALTLLTNCKHKENTNVQLSLALVAQLADSIRVRLNVDEKASSASNLINQPLSYSQELSGLLALLRDKREISGYMHYLLESKRCELVDNLGGCERILKTPMPFMMAVKSRRFILIFLLMLPLALVNASSSFTPLINGLVAYTLLALDQIAVEMQHPFSVKSTSHLPLEQITKTIASNLQYLEANQ